MPARKKHQLVVENATIKREEQTKSGRIIGGFAVGITRIPSDSAIVGRMQSLDYMSQQETTQNARQLVEDVYNILIQDLKDALYNREDE